VLSDIFVPDAGPEAMDSFARLQRASASAGVARDLLELYYATDVSDLLPLVQARTAVLHREGDTATGFSLGRRVAAAIPGAVLVPLAGRAHLFYVGDWEAVLHATVDFLLPAEAASVHLTPRELRVARLVAAGLTNQAIAADLGIAARTVDTHVGNIRGKLGARSRAQVAAWITEHDKDGRRFGNHGGTVPT
jgi:DNA-binding CsgD family transcriptional regulator